MEFFEISSVLMSAIGKTILHSLWLGLLILALLRLLLAHFPVGLSRLRYGISVGAILLLFISVLSAFLLLYDPGMLEPALYSTYSTALAEPGSAKIAHKIQGTLNSNYIFILFAYLYVAGVLFMLLRSMVSSLYIRRLRKSAVELGTGWRQKFSTISKSLGIGRRVNFFESGRVKGPVVLGFLRPAVIVPAGMLTNLPLCQVETIIMHELYHLKRKDYLVNILQLFIEGVLFYHPVVWIISDYIRSEREHCCDDGVLESTDNPIVYAKALIHIAEQKHFGRLVPGAVGSAKNQFYFRIKRILNYNAMKSSIRDKIFALALLVGGLILLLTVSSFSKGPALIRINKTSKEVKTSSLKPFDPVFSDTIPQKDRDAKLEEIEEEARREALKEIEEIDWESIREEVEEARQEALQEIEEIDLESIREEVEEARQEALKEIEEIDWESIREEVEEARREMAEIDWEKVKADLDLSLSEMKLDLEQLKMEIKNSMEEINWDKLREDLEKSRISLDSIKIEMDL